MDIAYPDGRKAQFFFQINDRDCECNPYAPPYPASWSGAIGLADHLGGMAPDGSQFWLYLGDGASVHFTRVPTSQFSGGEATYRATAIFDHHGLQTTLTYDDTRLNQPLPETHRLIQVQEAAGRTLDLVWGNVGWSKDVIMRVQSGSQAVDYSYTRYPYTSNSSEELEWWALTGVQYVEGPPAVYWYEVSNNFTGGFPFGPVLIRADDPRFDGPMTRIEYDYLRYVCDRSQAPNPPRPGEPSWDYFYPHPLAITAERSGSTAIPGTSVGQLVSSLAIDCFTGKRTETSGTGGQRIFYYGYSGHSNESGTEPDPANGYVNRAFELTKLTEFSTDPASAPFDFQRNYLNYPRRLFDGRGIRTEIIMSPGPVGHDGSGHVAEVRHVGSDQSTHTYNWTAPGASDAQNFSALPNPFPHWLFSQTDERNLTTTYRRDERRRVTDISYADGSSEQVAYNVFNQVTSHTLSSGAVQHYDYDGQGLLQQEWNSVDGPGQATTYTYYSLSNHPEWAGLVATARNPRAAFNNAAYSTMMEYNGRHQITKVHYPPTGVNPDPYVQYEYDDYGNCTAIINELGQRSEYEYDAYRRCTRYTEPLNALSWDGVSTVASRSWNWYYDRYFDGVGLKDASTHTSKQWRAQVEPAYNAAGDRRLSAHKFDYNDRIVEEAAGLYEATDGSWHACPDTEVHQFTYDENGQKKSYTDPQGRLSTYEYDLRDRLWKTNETVNSVPRTTETLYDTTGNKTLVKFPDLKTQQWLDYDVFGQAWRFVDERGNTTNLTYCWGPMKKLCTVITHRLKDDGATLENQPTTFWFDPVGRPTQVAFPDNSNEVTTYEFGQLKTWKTRKNQTKTIVYDARGREQSHIWNDGVTPGISRSWDDANRLASITSIWSSIDFAYDDAGQIIWEGDEIAGSGGRTQTNYYRYPDGSIAHLHYPGGHFVRHDYTARGQLAATGWDDDDNNWWMKLAAYTYLLDGKVDKVDYGNGMTSDPSYDPRGFIGAVQHKRTATGEVIASHSYTRDTRDRIVSLQKGYNPGSDPMENGRGDRFRYDEEGQLVEAWYNAADPANSGTGNTRYDGFAYDALGNRTQNNYVASRGLTSFIRRDNGLNQYSSWTPSIIYHDDNSPWAPSTSFPGNGVLMADGWLVASYNALNQPVAIVPFGWSDAVYFGYDPLGRCVKRWVGASGDVYSNPATYFHYDGWNLLQEGANAWGPARVYVHGNRVDEIVWSYNTFTGEQAFHHYDARGAATLLTDSSSNILEQYEYDAFGQPYFYDANGNSIGAYDAQGRWAGYSLFGNRFLFTGREWLSDLKLYDFRNRMYQPELGRFLQPDPKAFGAGDYNLYRYCHNDPINKTDPDGLVDLSYTPANDTAHVWESSFNPTDRFTVAGHANSEGIVQNGKLLTPQQVAKDMIGKGYTPDKKVLICACETGKGENPFASKLAKVLAKLTGAEAKVQAPTTKIASGSTRGAEPTIQPNEKTGKPGELKTFTGTPDSKFPKKKDN
jgi:RHS repeat-associated protein